MCGGLVEAAPGTIFGLFVGFLPFDANCDGSYLFLSRYRVLGGPKYANT